MESCLGRNTPGFHINPLAPESEKRHEERDASRRHTEFARTAAAEAIRSTRFGQLPAGVDLAPGELRIRFSGTNDFLQKFAAMVYALNNDFEGIREFIENGSPSRP